jgi:thiosulfate reductase cytochrome b subunit
LSPVGIRRAEARARRAKQEIVVYSLPRRIWHWLQAALVLLLLLTAVKLHFSAQLVAVRFETALWIHKLAAGLFALNTCLGAVVRKLDGEVGILWPRLADLRSGVWRQLRYYLVGRRKGEAPPFPRSPEVKFNPLQKFAYFGVLYLLLPVQFLTGAALWVKFDQPALVRSLGGSAMLSAGHFYLALGILLFLGGHVFMVLVTGPSWGSHLRVMVTGREVGTAIPSLEGSRQLLGGENLPFPDPDPVSVPVSGGDSDSMGPGEEVMFAIPDPLAVPEGGEDSAPTPEAGGVAESLPVQQQEATPAPAPEPVFVATMPEPAVSVSAAPIPEAPPGQSKTPPSSPNHAVLEQKLRKVMQLEKDPSQAQKVFQFYRKFLESPVTPADLRCVAGLRLANMLAGAGRPAPAVEVVRRLLLANPPAQLKPKLQTAMKNLQARAG